MNGVDNLDLNSSENSLTGSILVASPRFDGTCNEKLVVLINFASKEFIYGLALNRIAPNLDELSVLGNLSFEPKDKARFIDRPVYCGDPRLKRHSVTILHEKFDDTKFIFTEEVNKNLLASKSTDAFLSLISGDFPTAEYKIFLGHMLWTERQMYRLLKAGYFFRLPPNNDLCLRTPANELYHSCLNQFSFDLSSIDLGPEPIDAETLRNFTGASKSEKNKYSSFFDQYDF